MKSFHFLRPEWLGLLIPLLGLLSIFWQQESQSTSWAAVCDQHLLKELIHYKKHNPRYRVLCFLFAALTCMIFGLAGPSWRQLPVPIYQQHESRVVVLDMSDAMLNRDLLPDRLTRAKFKLQDLFKQHAIGQLGLVVYTSEPFVVSPLTDDAQTIIALLGALTPEIMPVPGQRLDSALEEASQLITQAGGQGGQILVLTSELPSKEAVQTAKDLAKRHIFTSVIPVMAGDSYSAYFEELAKAGQGQFIRLQDTSADIEQWLEKSAPSERYSPSKQTDIPLWRDEGRWFLLPALIFLLPVFRRGWVQRMNI